MNEKQLSWWFLLIVFLVGLFSAPPQECDIWWHLQNGREILVNHEWPNPDRYSYIAEGNHWVVHSWLADCFFYIVHSIMGFNGLIVFRLLVHMTLTVGIAIIASQSKIIPEWAMCIALIAFFLVCDREIRPFLFSEIAILVVYIYVRNSNPGRWVYLWMPLTMLLWVNVHPMSFIITIYLTLVILAKILIDRHKLPDSLKTLFSHYSKSWYKISALCLIASWIHPIPLSVFNRFLSAPSYGSADWENIFEVWYENPIVFFPWVLIVLVTTTIYIGSFCYTFLGNRKGYNLHEWLFCLLCILLSFFYVREIWLIIFPFTTTISYSFLIKKWSNKTGSRFRWEIPTLLYICLQIVRGVLPPTPVFPEEAMKYWNKNNMTGNLYTDWTWGGFVTWKTDKTAKTFVDTRMEPFTIDMIILGMAKAINISEKLGSLVELGTEYLLLPLPECQSSVDVIIEKHLGETLFQDELQVLIRLDLERIKKIIPV